MLNNEHNKIKSEYHNFKEMTNWPTQHHVAVGITPILGRMSYLFGPHMSIDGLGSVMMGSHPLFPCSGSYDFLVS